MESIGAEINGNFAGFTKPFTNPQVIAHNPVVFSVMGKFHALVILFCHFHCQYVLMQLIIGAIMAGIPIFAVLNYCYYHYRWREKCFKVCFTLIFQSPVFFFTQLE